MLQPIMTPAAISALETPILQGRALIANYEVLLKDHPVALVKLITHCLSALAKTQPGLASELLDKVYTIDGDYCPLFLADLQLRSFEAVLPALEKNSALSMCALTLWRALKSDPKNVCVLLNQFPKVLSSIPWFALLAQQLQDPSEQEFVLSLLRRICRPFSDTQSLQKDKMLDSLFKTLLDIYKTTKNAENSADTDILLDRIVHLGKYNIAPRPELMKEWLAHLYEDIKNEFTTEAMLPIYHVFATLLTFVSPPPAEPSQQHEPVSHYAQWLLVKLYVLTMQRGNPQQAHVILGMLVEKNPQLCLPLLLQENRLFSLTTLLDISSKLSDITLFKYSVPLCQCITTALQGANREEQRAALMLLQRNPGFFSSVMSALDGQGGWYGETLLSLALVCHEENVYNYVIDQATMEKLWSSLHTRLTNKDWDTGIIAAKFLDNFVSALAPVQREIVFPDLLTMLQQEKNNVVYIAAAKAVTRIVPLTPTRVEGVIPVLLARLQHQDSDVRRATIEVFEYLAPCTPAQLETIISALFARLQDTHWLVLGAASKVLGHLMLALKPAQVQHYISKQLVIFQKDYAPEQQLRSAVAAFGLLATALDPVLVNAVLAKLITRLQDRDAILLNAIVEALGRFASVLTPAQVDIAVSLLLRRLQDKSWSVCCAVVEALSRFGSILTPTQAKTVISAFLGMLKDEHGDELTAAAKALGRFPTLTHEQVKIALTTLLARLQHQDWGVRSCVIPALVSLSPLTPAQVQTVLTALVASLQDKHKKGEVCKAADEALDHFVSAIRLAQVEEVVPALLAMLQHQAWRVQSAAAKALGHVAHALTLPQVQSVVPLLQIMLQDDYPPVYSAAAKALGSLTHAFTPEQRRALQSVAMKHPELALFLPLSKIRSQCNHYLASNDAHNFGIILQSIKMKPKDFTLWLQHPETQPSAELADRELSLPLVALLFALARCQTLREGLPIIAQLMYLGLYYPAQCLIKAALQQQQLNYDHRRAIVDLLLHFPKFELNKAHLLALVTPVYLSESTPPALCTAIERFLFVKGVDTVREEMIEKCIMHIALGDHAALALLANLDLQLFIEKLVAQLSHDKKKSAAVQKLQHIPLQKLMHSISSVATQNPQLAELKKMINTQINSTDIDALIAVLKAIPTLTLLTYYLDQKNSLDGDKRTMLATIVKEKLATEPLPIRNNLLMIGTEAHVTALLLSEELQSTPTQIEPASPIYLGAP
jgi:HEAT repeat protein